jgi:hypothetical protein
MHAGDAIADAMLLRASPLRGWRRR